MTLYDAIGAIGRNYTHTRRSDPRIALKLLEILSCPPVSAILNVGAGTGSYAQVLAKHNHHVLAVEPSSGTAGRLAGGRERTYRYFYL